MLVVETIARIRREHLDRGKSIRQIARELKLSRNTVRKAIRGDVAAFGYQRTVQPLPKLGPWVGKLEDLLEANEGKRRRDRLSVLRIFERLQDEGYEGGYDAVRRYAASWRRRHSKSGSQAYVPLIFDPGEAYQFDWSHEFAVVAGTTTRVKAAHMRLCHSRLFLVQIFPREGHEMVFEAHERSFRFFGGVCRRGIYDNMKTAVQTVFVGKARTYNRRFLQMCSHHLVEPVACTPGAGWEKGQVESLRRVRARLACHEDSDRQVVKILAAVLEDGLEAVEAACAEALAEGTCSADVVLNILARRRQPEPSAPIPTPEDLRLRMEPIADCGRYERLMETHRGAA